MNNTNSIQGALLLIDCLIKHGVKYIFSFPGGYIDGIYEALRLRQDKIKLIVCRHEQNAGFMAGAYGRLTGEPGVVLVTAGPGVTNLVTALATATSEGDPVIALGGNVTRAMLSKKTHQYLDNVHIMSPVCKSAIEILSVDNIPESIEQSFRNALLGKPGAAFISIPQDILTDIPTVSAPTPMALIDYGQASETLIDQAATLINNAKNPVILVGMHASTLENTQAIRNLLAKLKCPAAATFQAAGFISSELFDCYAGRVGLFNNQPGDIAIQQADILITIGFEDIEYDPEIWHHPSLQDQKKIIHISTYPATIHMSYQPTLELIGNIAKNIGILETKLQRHEKLMHQQLVPLLNTISEKISMGKNKSGSRIHPLRFIYDLNQCTTENTTITCDVGSVYIWLGRYLMNFNPRHLLFSNGLQTMGVALPRAIAAKLVRPQEKIIAISGDGGFYLSATELETAVRENLPLVYCIWSDGEFNMVKEQQLRRYQNNFGIKFSDLDVVKFAESFGAIGYKVKHSDELLPTLKKALQQNVPVLIDIPIDYSDNPELFQELKQNVS